MKRQRWPTDELLPAGFSMEGVSEFDVRYTFAESDERYISQ